MIKAHLENAKRMIENEMQSEINKQTDICNREKILPHNAEVNALRDSAVIELKNELNQKIAELQEKFEQDKQVLIEKAEKNKTDFAQSEIAIVTSNIELRYKENLTKLQKQIDELKE